MLDFQLHSRQSLPEIQTADTTMIDTHRNPENEKMQLMSSTDRTVLANERTLAAWLRTGLAGLVAALAIEKYLVDVVPQWNHAIIVSALLVFSIAAFILASWRYAHVHIRLQELEVEAIPRLAVRLICYGLAACSLLALFGVWSLGLLGIPE